MHEGDEEESAGIGASEGESETVETQVVGGEHPSADAGSVAVHAEADSATIADTDAAATLEADAASHPESDATPVVDDDSATTAIDADSAESASEPVPAELDAEAPDALEPLAEEQPVEVDERLVGILESVLFACAEPMTLARISEVVAGPSRAEIKAALGALAERLENDRRGIRLVEVAGGHQFRTAPEHAEWVRRLFQQRPWRLTRATLETLAIVAYKQPITRAEIETIRGVDVDSVLAALLSRKLVKITGRKEVVGRPLLYGTTRQFLEVFGLRDLAALPGLAEVASAMPESVGAGAVGGEESWSGDDRPDEGHTAAEAAGGLGDLLPSSGGDDDHQRPGDGERQDGQDPGDSGTPD